jgi:uncharacterized phage protein gp47/JayE
MIPSPVVLYPMTNWVAGEDNKYYTDSLETIISGSVSTVPEEEVDNFYISVMYKVQITNEGQTSSFSSYTDAGITVGSNSNVVDSLPWSLDTAGVIDFEVGLSAKIVLRAVKKNRFSGFVEDESAEVSITVEVISEDTVNPTILSTSALEMIRSKEKLTLRVPKDTLRFNANSKFAGVNFYVSLESGGGTSGYYRINKTAITEIDDRETTEEILTDDIRVDSASDATIRTIKTRTVDKEYYTFTFDQEVISNLMQSGDLPNVFLTDGQTLDTNVSYFFVATVTAFDNVLNRAVDSIYSVEKEGRFINYSLDTQSLPLRSRDSILNSMTQDLLNNDKNINTSGGSVFRDILDPISLEFEKFYVIQDFIFACNSVDTLVAYDDPNGDGISDTTSESILKRRLRDALQLNTDDALQLLIDQQFDKLASNRGISRTTPKRSRGFVTFYTKIKPANDIRIPSGLTLVSNENAEEGQRSAAFRTIGTSIIDASNPSYYYNTAEQRYEIDVEIEAIQSGSSGNIPAGAITTSDALGPAVRVINNSAIVGGAETENNQHLADRIKLSSVSLDAGTPGGYTDTVLSVPGVEQVRVEEAGDSLMLRDYDRSEKKHIGGKVDIYIKGYDVAQTVDIASFKYNYPKDVLGSSIAEQLKIVSSAEYRLKVTNTNVNEQSPIVSVSYIRNVTRGSDYDLTGLQIVGDGDTVILEKNESNNRIGISAFDVIEMSYKYRSNNTIVLENQPVESIVSVVDSNGNTIDPSLYELVKVDDPLDIGQSSISRDRIRFLLDRDSGVDDILEIEGEQIDLIIGTPTKLNNKGVDGNSIVITSIEDPDTVYVENVDYNVILGNDSERTEIELLPNSMIRPGSRVSVSYRANMNFRITYRYNSLIGISQEAVDGMKHSCADTIVKQATQNYIDIGFTVYKKNSADSEANNSLLLSRIKVSINNYLSKMSMGETFTQSKLVKVVSSVEGVADVKVPLTKMSKRNGSFIPLENLGFVNFELYQKVSGRGVPSYVSINSVLRHRTVDTGGPSNLFRGVYENNIPLTLVNTPNEVAREAGRGYIYGDGRILVSTTDGQPPQSKEYKVSYYVNYPEDINIVEDIDTTEIEYLDVDEDSLKNVVILKEETIKRGL